jgi:hypothetical protein
MVIAAVTFSKTASIKGMQLIHNLNSNTIHMSRIVKLHPRLRAFLLRKSIYQFICPTLKLVINFHAIQLSRKNCRKVNLKKRGTKQQYTYILYPTYETIPQTQNIQLTLRAGLASG